MKTFMCIVAFGATGLTGCASVPLPPQAASVAITPVSSGAVSVLQPKLISKDGRLAVVGSVYKTFGGPPTNLTHLDVVFLDHAGRPLSEKTAMFAPRMLHRTRPPAGRGHYSLVLEELPPGTASVEVRAHDGEHSKS
jgi:hypothetical protein